MKQIFITGISRGFGFALAQEFILRGHHVFGLLRNAADLSSFSDQEREHITRIMGDVRDASTETTIKKALAETPLDLLINNAGNGGRTYTLEGADLEEVRELFDIHCLGVMRVTRAATPNLLRSADPTIINVNSRMGSLTWQFEGKLKHLETSYSYRIAKGAQNMLTACLHSEFGDQIKIHSVTPGRLKTAISQSDARVEPRDAAKRLVDAWESGSLPVTSGITEAGIETIPW